MQADHVLRARGGRRDGVQIEVRGVGSEHRTRARHGVDALEHLLLHTQLFEHSFDDQVGLRQIGPVQTGLEPGFNGCGTAGVQLAGLHPGGVVRVDARGTALQCRSVLLQQRHTVARVEGCDGDARAHGAGADHGHMLHRTRCCLVQRRDVWRCRARRKTDVARRDASRDTRSSWNTARSRARPSSRPTSAVDMIASMAA